MQQDLLLPPACQAAHHDLDDEGPDETVPDQDAGRDHDVSSREDLTVVADVIPEGVELERHVVAEDVQEYDQYDEARDGESEHDRGHEGLLLAPALTELRPLHPADTSADAVQPHRDTGREERHPKLEDEVFAVDHDGVGQDVVSHDGKRQREREDSRCVGEAVEGLFGGSVQPYPERRSGRVRLTMRSIIPLATILAVPVELSYRLEERDGRVEAGYYEEKNVVDEDLL